MSSRASAYRLAVLGSPIAHSKSPAIHQAAYSSLALDFTYEAIEVAGRDLGEFVASLDESWRGLSLTMPLKRDILALLHTSDPLVKLTGAANTVLFDKGVIRGFNTDVGGFIRSFTNAGIASLGRVHLLGAGATAASALVAVAKLGADSVIVSARSPERAQQLVELGETLGTPVTVRAWGVMDRSLIVPDAVISTVPGNVDDMTFAGAIRTRSVLFDVSYDPWPSELAMAWSAVGGTVISGLDLLINQALGQIRLFVQGDVDCELPNEEQVLGAMRAAVG